jgi:polyphosphate kinase
MKHLINRELSWLSFNERVLQEAEDVKNPLIERLRFLGIFSNNLDEFFRVRVATIARMLSLEQQASKDLGMKPSELLKKIHAKVVELQKRFDRDYLMIREELKKERVFIINENDLTASQGGFVKKYYHEKVRQEVFPIMVREDREFPTLHDSSIYLAIRFYKLRPKGEKAAYSYSVIEVPTHAIPRFLVLPKEGDTTFIIFIDDVIRYNLRDIFSIFPFDKIEAYTIKFTRDAELDIDNDVSTSFLDALELSLKQRKEGDPLRFVFDKQMPANFQQFLMQKLNIEHHDAILPGARYHNFKDFMRFPNIGGSHLVYQYRPQLRHNDLAMANSMLDTLKKKDILLYYPYHTFDHFLDLLREAALDPLVSHVRITLYRMASDSYVIRSLINAARNGKDVTVVVELRARFDEEANIHWANILREEGIKVITGVPGLKVHSKLCLITRREGGKKIYYGGIGTGNFHEKTAKVYTDAFMLTANQSITREAREMFTFFEQNYLIPRLRNLLVAPFNLRSRLIFMINRESRNARAGKPAEIIMKMNSLVDEEMIDRLYFASKSGVKVRLIVRGICSLIPGLPKISENIEAISLIGKFLEHPRIFVFGPPGNREVYLGSADLMTRNLDYRVELVCPVLDENVKQQIIDILDIQWNGNQKVRFFDKDQQNRYRLPAPGEPPITGQEAIYDYFEELAKK